MDDAGVLADGTPIEAITLRNRNGLSARILSYGATLQSLIAPDRNGVFADLVLGHDTLSPYIDRRDYFGVTVGRYANRIAGGSFVLDGRRYDLPLNDGRNTLHGGGDGFDRQAWQVLAVEDGPPARVILGYRSSDGEGGFPGNLDVTVSYALDDADDLIIDFAATTDMPTIVNLTNHATFDLSGSGTTNGAMGHRLTVAASMFTPVDESLIPTGQHLSVSGTVFDFRRGRVLADGLRDGSDAQIRIGRGYDHNFVLDKGATATPGLAARLEDPASGRALEVLTTEPGIQVYTGNSLDGTQIGKGDRLYRMGDGIALEPQKFPDTPNRPAFGSARIDPGQPYRHTMIYRLSTI